jgi:hypothetical protein
MKVGIGWDVGLWQHPMANLLTPATFALHDVRVGAALIFTLLALIAGSLKAH